MLVHAFIWLMLQGFAQDRAIVSTSMQPTLVMGEVHPFANSRLFGAVDLAWLSAPKRGDIVLVRVEAENADFVERIIGLPGETVQMQAGRLYIDGQLVERKSLGTVEDRDPFGDLVPMQRYREHLPGAAPHVIQEIDDSQVLDDTPLFTVPPEHYFVMADNRDNSADSRISGRIGFIHRRDVVARLVDKASGGTP